MTLYPFRTALILLAGASLSACSTYEPFADSPTQLARPSFPIRTASASVHATTAKSEDLSTDPSPVVYAPVAVESRVLQSPRGDSASLVLAAYHPKSSHHTQAPSPVKAAAGGKVVDAAGPAKTHTVKKGENLDMIARAMGVTVKDLADENELKKPYRLHPGDEITAPRSSAKAYVVEKGDTLSAVARRFNVTNEELADANDITAKSRIVPGHKLILPEGFKDKGAGKAAKPPAEDEPEQVADKTHGKAAHGKKSSPEDEPDATPTKSATKTSVNGKVVSFAGKAISYKVKKGDAVDSIADDLDMTRQELAKANKLKPPYRLHPGQILKGPPQQLKGYMPVAGDTLALVGKRFGVTAKALAAANGIKPTGSVRPGHRLTLPSGVHDHGPLKETARDPLHPTPRRPVNPDPDVVPPATPTNLPPSPQPYAPTPRPAYPRPSPTVSPPRPQTAIPGTVLTDAQVSALGRGRFSWPLRGDMLADFGPKGTGQRNDGINVRARLGDPVRAAADGEVVYAGDQVPGFGFLILIKHSEGWVTTYSHLSRTDVKNQQRVTQGQQIGQVGQTGGVSEPQLHFEVRYAPNPAERARPVNPQLVLPR